MKLRIKSSWTPAKILGIIRDTFYLNKSAFLYPNSFYISLLQLVTAPKLSILTEHVIMQVSLF